MSRCIFDFRCVLAVGILWLLTISPHLSAQNLIVNGDFEAGNTGFSSGYTYDSDPPMRGQGHYAIGNNPKTWNSFWDAFPDHTPGSGQLMFIADGATTSNVTVWQQTVTVSSHTPYVFSYWAASCYSQSPATLRTYINDVQVGDLTLPSQTGNWQQFSVLWNSGSATSATIRLVNLNTRGVGNDFVLDDISMQAVPEPASVWTFLTGAATILLRRRAHRA